MTRAMLLCAGLGSRLGNLGEVLPKPMFPVLNYPILRYGIANLAAQGISDLVINLYHQGQEIVDALGDGSALGVRIQYSRETTLLGTGGGLKHALHLLDPDGKDQPFLSLNGKLIFDVDFAPILATYRATPSALGVMVVRPVPDAEAWGAVDISTDSIPRVKNILGSGKHMFCGVHVTRPSVIRRLPDGEACMVRQGYLPWLQNGELVAAHVVNSNRYFAEHSTPERYLQSNIDLLSGASVRHPPGPLSGVDAGAHIDPSSTVTQPVAIAAGVRVGARCKIGPCAVLGAGAVVADGTTMERAIAWPNARVSGTVTDTIVGK